MRKFMLRSGVMAAAAYVEEAREWAHALTQAESRFPGDYGLAMSRVAGKAKVPARLLWRLRYRVPKTINTDHYAALGVAYADEQSKYRADGHSVIAKTMLGRLLVRAADALDSAADALDR